ncbi:hypothetical protein VTO42DRAFT_5407 [Malbranchea cinnamomea]
MGPCHFIIGGLAPCPCRYWRSTSIKAALVTEKTSRPVCAQCLHPVDMHDEAGTGFQRRDRGSRPLALLVSGCEPLSLAG